MSIIEEKYIFVDLDVNTQDELFETLGGKLIESDVVKSTYVDALKDREGEFPTGLPLPIGVAIPHTDGSYVNEDHLVVATLSKPVDFVEMGTDDEKVDVSLVIMIVMQDGKNHLEMLQNIIATVQNEELVKELLQEKDKKVIKEILDENILNKGE